MKVINVVGARPNFVKICPIVKEMGKELQIEALLVHTGQHYDHEMSKVFFEDLDLPQPDIYLGVGSGSHAQQTARIMLAFEPVLLEHKPDWVIVVGDVNSTVAGALTAVKLGVKVAHVEAGLRSFDRTMPEEINRIATDSLSDFLFTTCEDADENLRKEGISNEKIFFVGNVMIDTLKRSMKKIRDSTILNKYSLKLKSYALMTLHRPENVDRKDELLKILSALYEIQRHIKLIFPMHPRTEKMLEKFSLYSRIKKMPNLLIIPPIGYLDFLTLETHACFVLTDSGGIQEETTVLNVPCLTIRRNTERPVTVREGTNIVVHTDKEKIVNESLKIINGDSKQGKIPKLWDGKAAQRIVKIIRGKV